jgi:hypothetical protein
MLSSPFQSRIPASLPENGEMHRRFPVSFLILLTRWRAEKNSNSQYPFASSDSQKQLFRIVALLVARCRLAAQSEI